MVRGEIQGREQAAEFLAGEKHRRAAFDMSLGPWVEFTAGWCGSLVCDFPFPEMGSLLHEPFSFHFNPYFLLACLCGSHIRFQGNCQLLEMCPS